MARNGAVARPGAQRWVPERPALPALRSAVHECRGCELYRDATQAVFSSGRASAALMLVGEQPGIGRTAMDVPSSARQAGCSTTRSTRRASCAVSCISRTRSSTSGSRSGKRRIHKTPDVPHIVACRPWLEAELAAVRRAVIVCLGAVAARSLFGRPVRIAAERGKVLQAGDRVAVVTTHPSAIVRLHGEPEFPPAFEALVHDLRVAAEASSAHPVSRSSPGP